MNDCSSVMLPPTEVAVGDFATRRPAVSPGKANVLGEVTGTCTLGAAGVEVQTRREGLAEITTGRACAQQGLTATCKDLEPEALPRATGGQRSGA